MNIVILGCGAAGFGAALAVKKQSRDAKITFIDDKDFNLMHQCGLPYAIDGEIKSLNDLKHDIGAKRMGMDFISNAKLQSIDVKNKVVILEDNEVPFDKLIIATGALPFIPPIKTDNKIHTVHNLKDTNELMKAKEKRAIVIGAGAIGLETAVALKNNGKDVELYDLEKSIFPRAIDGDMAKLVEDRLITKGIKLNLGKKIDEIKEKAIVVMATGVKPNTDFCDDLEKERGAFITNDKMQTSNKDIYAVGDCASVKSSINGERWTSILANNAYKQGCIAGANAAGGKKKYVGIQGTFISVVDKLEVAATGFNAFFADLYKIETISGKAKGKHRPEWFGDADDLIVKIIADKKGVVIGAQAIGNGAKERVNILSTAIRAKMTLQEVSDLELAYCPPVSDYIDVLTMAAEFALRRMQ